ncbi:hypothetical protein MY3296_008940 [Beauveria thailandica]
MNQNSQFSKLESLNYDIRLAILGACDSFEDLAALIRASPTLFHTFLSNKPSLLLSVVGNILGPATQDAALLAEISLDESDDVDRQVDQVVHDYKAHWRVTGPPWVKGLDAETVVALTHITRDTQFCVDMYGRIQRWQLIHSLLLSDHDATFSGPPGLSRNERIRIAQAILRRQVLGFVSKGKFWQSADEAQVMRALLPLFRTWEWHQISDMDHFMSFLICRLEFSRDEWLAFDQRPDLEVIVQRLKIVLSSDDASLDSIGSIWLDYVRENLYWGILDFLKGSHSFRPPLLNGSQHSNTFDDDDDSSLESDIDDQPWAWRDALCGNKTCRWGLDLVDASVRHADWAINSSLLAHWRSFGMVFWDRERAERLKQMSALEGCQTGWLIPWQD